MILIGCALIYRYNKVRNIGSLAIYIDTNQQASGC